MLLLRKRHTRDTNDTGFQRTANFRGFPRRSRDAWLSLRLLTFGALIVLQALCCPLAVHAAGGRPGRSQRLNFPLAAPVTPSNDDAHHHTDSSGRQLLPQLEQLLRRRQLADEAVEQQNPDEGGSNRDNVGQSNNDSSGANDSGANDSGSGGAGDNDSGPNDGNNNVDSMEGVSSNSDGNAGLPSPPPRLPPLVPFSLAPSANTSATISERCVFVLGTGRSGSTALVDALNQLPNYLIRGEQGGAFWHLYHLWKLMRAAWRRSDEIVTHTKQLSEQRGNTAGAHLGYDVVKQLYERHAVTTKMPWFNDVHPTRITAAVQGMYVATYGYHGPGIVSGFKEIRYVQGRAFPSQSSKYEDFEHFVGFLRLMCRDVKLLLNSRASDALDDNAKLGNMLKRKGLVSNNATFQKDLRATHEWYDRYVSEHPDHAFRVLMEDMFDPQKNATLAHQMLVFLGEDPSTRISFSRMPMWTDSTATPAARKRRSKRAKGPKDKAWDMRRRRRMLGKEGGAVEVGRRRQRGYGEIGGEGVEGMT